MESALTVSVRTSPWRRLAKLAVLAAFAVVGLWWLILLTGPERYWLSGAFLYLPYWLYLPPVVVASAMAWPLGWRWRAIGLATLFIVLWPIMGFSFGWPETGFSPVRVMTYNVKSYVTAGESSGFAEIAAEIERHNPDIIVMQDADLLKAASAVGSSAIKQALARRAVFAHEQYIVASRLPLRQCEAGSIAYGDGDRSYVHCVVTAHKQDIDLYTAHFSSPRRGLNAFRWEGLKGSDNWQASTRARMTQAEKLAQAVLKRTHPAIVAGDLNAPEPSLVIQTLLGAGLRDAFSSAGLGYGYTHGHSLRPHISSTSRIDHILVSREIGVADCFVGGKDGSEHRPVIADLWVY